MKKKFVLIAIVFASWLLVAEFAGAKEPLKFIFITTCKDEAFFEPVKKGMQRRGQGNERTMRVHRHARAST